MTDSARRSGVTTAPEPVRRFDLDLFLALNEEYRDKPVVPQPRSLTPEGLTGQADRRAKTIARKVGVSGKRILEVGSGRGHLGQTLLGLSAANYVGVDVVEYAEWPQTASADLQLVRRDISVEDSADLGEFDLIVSLAVLEHVVHPHAMLSAMFERLKPGGVLYLAANLYRGCKASHRYRQVNFPWPHLLFEDPVWREFYRGLGRDETFSWVNKLTHAQYLLYFDMIGFRRRETWVTSSSFDEAFYRRFEDQLSRYPIFDLSHDFIYAILERPATGESGTLPGEPRLSSENERLRREIAALRGSTSWRVTAPLRRLSDLRRR